MDYGDYYWGLYRGYYRDPFLHSLRVQGVQGKGLTTFTRFLQALVLQAICQLWVVRDFAFGGFGTLNPKL